jgi:hypothetical protein
VSWETVCKPYHQGGIDIKNLKMQGLALRVHWDLFKRPWQVLPLLKDTLAGEVFDNFGKNHNLEWELYPLLVRSLGFPFMISLLWFLRLSILGTETKDH